MSAETETAEIIRRRLFDWAWPARMTAKKTAAAYADGWSSTTADGRRRSTPTRPGSGSWRATRSTLRCCPSSSGSGRACPGSRRRAACCDCWPSGSRTPTSEGYKGAHRDPLIGLGTAPLEDPYFRAALFEQLGNNDLEGPVTTDIAGKKDAHAAPARPGSRGGGQEGRLHQKVATAILFESNGGQTRAEATMPEIRLAVAEPDLDIANVETALEALAASCYYLSGDRNRYRFSLSPNLNKILTDRRAATSRRRPSTSGSSRRSRRCFVLARLFPSAPLRSPLTAGRCRIGQRSHWFSWPPTSRLESQPPASSLTRSSANMERRHGRLRAASSSQSPTHRAT